MSFSNRKLALLLGAASAAACVGGFAWGGGGPDTDSPYNMPKLAMLGSGTTDGFAAGFGQGEPSQPIAPYAPSLVQSNALSVLPLALDPAGSFAWVEGATQQAGVRVAGATVVVPGQRITGNTLVASGVVVGAGQAVEATQSGTTLHLAGSFGLRPSGLDLRLVPGDRVQAALCVVEILGSTGAIERQITAVVGYEGFDLTALHAAVNAAPSLAGKQARVTLWQFSPLGVSSVRATFVAGSDAPIAITQG